MRTSKLGQRLAEKTRCRSWAKQQQLPVITFEFEAAGIHPLRAKYEPIFVELLGTA